MLRECYYYFTIIYVYCATNEIINFNSLTSENCAKYLGIDIFVNVIKSMYKTNAVNFMQITS